MEYQMNKARGIRAVVTYDEDGKPIDVKIAEFVSAEKYAEIERRVKLYQKNKAEEESKKREEDEKKARAEAAEKERLEREKAHAEKYSKRNFLFAAMHVDREILNGTIEDDENHPLSTIVSGVLNGEKTVEDALQEHDEVRRMFELLFGKEE